MHLNLQDYFLSLKEFIQAHPKLQNLILFIGLLQLSCKAFKILRFIYTNFLRPQMNLIKRYGQGSWVLVTGASDGIGKQLCVELAKLGFNIMLVARNLEKLQKAEQEIKKANQNVSTQIIICDFSASSTNKSLFDKVQEATKQKDVSILINNVGVDLFNKFDLLDDEKIKEVITINCLPITLLTKRLLPQMRSRGNKKSCVINVTSLAGEIPTAYFNVYSASKAYGEFLSKILSYEYPEIDFMSVMPSEVSTQMTFNRQPDILTITANDCAKGIIKHIGYDRSTYGDWRHHLQAVIYHMVPLRLYNYVLIKFIAPQWFKEREGGEQQKQKLQ